MFITNIDCLKNTKLFKCNKELSLFLLKNGFFTISIKNGNYIYILDDKLKTFLINHNIDINGGECV